MDNRPQTDTQETIMSNWTSEEKSYISLDASRPLTLSLYGICRIGSSSNWLKENGFRASCIRCWVVELTILATETEHDWLKF